jgi:hypothetical protein
MQVVIHVMSSGPRSLRDAIVSAPHALEEDGLSVIHEKRQTRSRGWAKIKCSDSSVGGALNLEWNAATKVLVVRSVIRSKARREVIVARVLSFLFTSFATRVRSVHVFRV